MQKLIHHSPLGDLEIPTVLGVVAPEEPFEVDDDIAVSLLAQHELFSFAPGVKTADVTHLAGVAGIEAEGLSRADLIAALQPAEARILDVDAPTAAVDEAAVESTIHEADPADENTETPA